ncbi:MAG: xylanase, partial [Armatimonadota bacterium]|nr:xylanase [Armatimonadota bacterium]
VVLWTDDPADYRIQDPDRLRTRVLSRVFGGGVVLLHQGVPATLQVLPELVRTLRRLNYHVGTVTDLLHP